MMICTEKIIRKNFILIFILSMFMLGLSSCTSFDNDYQPAMSGYEKWDEFQKSQKKNDETQLDLQLGQTPTLRECQLYAAIHNPQLEAAFHEWQAALAEIPQAQALPNPKLSYTYFFVNVETRTGPQRQALALQQTLPAWGKIAARTDAAASVAKSKWQNYQAVKFDIYARVQQAWAELYYGQIAVDLTHDNLLLLKQVEQVIKKRYRTSKAENASLLRIQVDLEKIDDRLETLTKRLAPLQAALNKELGRNSNLPIKIEKFPDMPVLNIDSPKAYSALAAQNPGLLAIREEISAADSNIKLAKAYQLPDVTLGVGWIDTAKRVGVSDLHDNGKDPVTGTISLDMPIWFEANQAKIRQARHQKSAVELQFNSELLNSQTDLEEALFQHEDTQRRIALYKNILLPKAMESWKVTHKRYINQLASYNDMIDTFLTLLEFELALQRAKTNCLVARGQLQKLTTKTVEELAKKP